MHQTTQYHSFVAKEEGMTSHSTVRAGSDHDETTMSMVAPIPGVTSDATPIRKVGPGLPSRSRF